MDAQISDVKTGIVRYLFLFIMPFLIYVRLADGENWQGMPTSEAQEQNFTEEELQAICGNKLYRCNKLTDAKKSAMRCSFTDSRRRLCIPL